MALRILSGMRPTGMLHLGNYFGAIQQFLAFQKQDCERFYFVADLHALTTQSFPEAVNQATLEITRGYLACGLNPNLSAIYKQSSIAKIPCLALLLGMFTSESWLRKCTTFKEKAEKQEIVSFGLLGYPVLMAADILIMNANLVPVGHDQLQHLEMVRDIAQKFNANYQGSLLLPEAIKMKALRVPGLDGKGKMGKSDQNFIGLFEDPKIIEKKVQAAVTDSGDGENNKPSQPLENLFYLLHLVASEEVYQKFWQMFESGQRKFYGELKKELAKQVIAFLDPFRARYFSKEANLETAKEILTQGAKKANPIAEQVFEKAYSRFQLEF